MSTILRCDGRRRQLLISGGTLEAECQVFGNDFVAPLVVQFLDVPSLVAFSSTCRHHRALLPKEVQRRKERFRRIRSDIHDLLSPPRRIPIPDVLTALQLQAEARRLVDGGLDWLDAQRHLQERMLLPGECCGTCQRDRLFLSERLCLKPHCLADASQRALLLPTLFYASERALAAPDGDLPRTRTTREGQSDDIGIPLFPVEATAWQQERQQEQEQGENGELERQLLLIQHLWCGERLSFSRRHVRDVVLQTCRALASGGSRRPYGCNLDHPLRVFHLLQRGGLHDVEQMERQIVRRTAERLVGAAAERQLSAVEAFRVAARTFVAHEPLSLPLLLWILADVERLLESDELR